MKVSGQLHARAALLTGKNTSTHWRERWLNTGAGLDVLEARKITWSNRYIVECFENAIIN
jgi:hypothetical protein